MYEDSLPIAALALPAWHYKRTNKGYLLNNNSIQHYLRAMSIIALHVHVVSIDFAWGSKILSNQPRIDYIFRDFIRWFSQMSEGFKIVYIYMTSSVIGYMRWS